MSTRKKKPAPSTENVTTLDQLERMVRWSDSFTLAFVKCNAPLQCREHIAQLKERLDGKRLLEIRLDKPIVSLLDTITAHWDVENPPNAVCVFGLEASINEEREASQVLGRLNHDRDLLRRAVSCTLLIWLPDFALDCLVRGAPDFWAWRSGVYEFPTDVALWQADSVAALSSDLNSFFSLNLVEKQAEQLRIETLLRTAQSLNRRSKREQLLIAHLLSQLGVLHYSLGQWNLAQTRLEQTLEIFQRYSDNSGVARTLYLLGMLKLDQGDIDEAEHFYEKSLQIDQELGGDKGAIAATLHELGRVKQNQGKLDEAERLYEQSLQIAQELKNESNIASTLHQLGMLKQNQGKLDEAMRLYEQSLQIAYALGDESGSAHTISQLGNVLFLQGNLEKAAQLYEQSLQIARKLGNERMVATIQWQIGRVQEQQGQLHEAFQNLVAAWDQLRKFSSPNVSFTQKYLQQIREQIGDEKFEALLTMYFPAKQAKEILKALE